MSVVSPPTVLILLLATACSRQPSEVFVPGRAFRQTIHLSTAHGDRATVGLGKPLILHAQRSTGPWVRAARSTLTVDTCWLASPPPDSEPEVADNITWLVDPSGAATFNLGIRPDHTREVRFSRPGVYQLSAESAVWCPPRYGGNTLTVEVLAE